jgi:hypothetical protein
MRKLPTATSLLSQHETAENEGEKIEQRIAAQIGSRSRHRRSQSKGRNYRAKLSALSLTAGGYKFCYLIRWLRQLLRLSGFSIHAALSRTTNRDLAYFANRIPDL